MLKPATSAVLTTVLLGTARLATAAMPQRLIHVANVRALEAALAAANRTGGFTTIEVARGVYPLDHTLDVEAPGITIEGATGTRDAVVIEGDGMSSTARIGNVVRVAASQFELKDVTLQRSRSHLIQVAGETGAEAPRIHDCILRDAYEQMLKVSLDPARPQVTSNDGSVENCVFEYSARLGPQYYIGGIDAHGAKHWIVRGNTFRNIASPSQAVAEFAIHFWDGSADDVVERNLIVNCDRGIGFGMNGRPNSGGIIRNNMIYHAANGAPYADVGIALLASPGTEVYNNTIFFADDYPRAIEYRFPATRDVVIANNLTNRAIDARDGAAARETHNVTGAEPNWFVNASVGNLHLAGAIPGVVHAGERLSGLTDDFDGDPRPVGADPDIGADQR